MTTDDRKYLAYLTAWAVDRLVTAVDNTRNQFLEDVEPSTHLRVLERANDLWEAYPWPEEKSDPGKLTEPESRPNEGALKIAGGIAEYLFKEPEKKPEMSARELVERMRGWCGRYNPYDDNANHYLSYWDLFNFAKKEAGL